MSKVATGCAVYVTCGITIIVVAHLLFYFLYDIPSHDKIFDDKCTLVTCTTDTWRNYLHSTAVYRFESLGKTTTVENDIGCNRFASETDCYYEKADPDNTLTIGKYYDSVIFGFYFGFNMSFTLLFVVCMIPYGGNIAILSILGSTFGKD